MVAGLLVGIQTYYPGGAEPSLIWGAPPPELDDDDVGMMEPAWVTVVDNVILLVFTIECFIKVFAQGIAVWRYWLGPEWRWNNFDFFVVLLCMPFVAATLPSAFSGAAILRMMRLARLMKLIRKVVGGTAAPATRGGGRGDGDGGAIACPRATAVARRGATREELLRARYGTTRREVLSGTRARAASSSPRRHGCMWTRGHVDTWTRGHVDMWARGHVDVALAIAHARNCAARRSLVQCSSAHNDGRGPPPSLLPTRDSRLTRAGPAAADDRDGPRRRLALDRVRARGRSSPRLPHCHP